MKKIINKFIKRINSFHKLSIPIMFLDNSHKI